MKIHESFKVAISRREKGKGKTIINYQLSINVSGVSKISIVHCSLFIAPLPFPAIF